MTEYNTTVTYEGDGITDTFAVPFSYRDEDEVVVTRAGGSVVVTFLSPSSIQIDAPLAVDDTLTISRDTNITTPDVVWSGQTVVGGDVNTVVEQLINAIQEVKDTGGPQGDQGEQGVPGTPGADGADGDDGLDGSFEDRWRGTWSGATAYASGDLVYYSGSSYLSILDGINKNPTSETSYWTLVAMKGQDGGGAGDMTTAIYDPDEDGKVSSAEEADSVPWTGVTGKPSTFTPATHNHDDLYFTEAEVTSALAGKSDTDHTHDDLYFTESEVTTALAGKSDTGHTHDTRYYTESEVDALIAAVATSKIPDRQTFNASGTWTKPSGFSSDAFAVIEAWGGGGSGAKGSFGDGGGGGACVRKTVPLSSLSSTETVTIGAGGASVSSSGAGNNGGDTTFGSHVTSYGGRGANGSAGGGGGGPLGAGSGKTPGAPLMDSGWNSGSTAPLRMGQGGDSSDIAGQDGYDHGGGGGHVNGTGGKSVNGGGGGGGFNGSAGGTSISGGAGGAGSSASSGVAGTQPGGGGGGTNTGSTSGAGADGRVIITVYEAS